MENVVTENYIDKEIKTREEKTRIKENTVLTDNSTTV